MLVEERSRLLQCRILPGAMDGPLVLKPEEESPGELVTMQIAGCQPQSFYFHQSGLEISISNRFPGEVETPGSGTAF